MDSYLKANPSGDVVRVEGEQEVVLHCPLSSRPSNGHCRVDCAWFRVYPDRTYGIDVKWEKACEVPLTPYAHCGETQRLGVWRA